MTVQLTVPVALPALRAHVQQAIAIFARPTPLLKAWGVTTLREVGLNFEAEGRPAWTALRPNTIEARRKGKGAGGARILQDTGRLRKSFDMRLLGDTAVEIFSTDPKAVFHEFGTRPYTIRPKTPGGVLAIPVAAKSLEGMGRSRGPKAGGGYRVRAGSGRVAKREGRTAQPFEGLIFRKAVKHPGLPARPMLPTAEQLEPILEKAGAAFLAHVLRRRAGRA